MLNRFVLLCLAGVLCSPSAVRAEFALQSDDRVVFFGDNLVTTQGFSRYVETFVRVKYPQLHTHFFNCGLRDMTARNALQRLQDDVTPLQPTVVVVVLGLHDPGRQAFDQQRLEEFQQDYAALIERIAAMGSKMVLVTPPKPLAEHLAQIPEVAYGEVIARYAAAIKDLGGRQNLPVVDWFESSKQLYEQRRDIDPRPARTRHRDERPSLLAHAVVAAQILKLWHAEPIQVDIELDWLSDQASTSAGQVRIQNRDAGSLTASLTRFPLPWALPRLLPIKVKDLNWPGSDLCQLNLRVANVPDAGISLIWQKKRIAVDTEQLAQGLNIAHWHVMQFSKPLNELVRYINKKHRYRSKLWREVLPLRPKEPELQAAFESQITTLQLWEEGTAKIIFRLPRTFDFVLKFEVNAATGEQPTTQPAEERGT